MLEIACFNATSAIAAANAGADRLELCANYAVGGITPSLDSLQHVKKETIVPVNVMIRPRAGNFNYSHSEFQQMKSEIELFKSEASGFVFGILDDNHHVDEERNRALVELAAPLPCTFHRAFDQIPDLNGATEKLLECGFTSVLTSGGQTNAVTGADRVVKLQAKFGDRITFILGGGVRSTNVDSLRHQTHVSWYHSAAITKVGEDVDDDEVAQLQRTLSRVI